MKIKIWSIMIFTLIVIFSCEKEKNNPEVIIQKDVDSTIYNIEVSVKNGNVVGVSKYLNKNLTESLTINYQDTMVIKQYYHFDSLIYKRVYFLDLNKYAKYSIDSFYYEKRYFTTLYTYNENGYLTKEKITPGEWFYSKDGSDNFTFLNNPSESTEFSEIDYNEYNGNNYKETSFPYPNVASTGYYDYKYSSTNMTYDILLFNNLIKGRMNVNLPSSYGYQMDIKPATYTEMIRFEYELSNGLVIKRIDNYLQNNIVVSKNIFYYSYK